MLRRFAVTLVGILGLSLNPAARAANDCKLARMLELPVTMSGLRPLVGVKTARTHSFWPIAAPSTA